MAAVLIVNFSASTCCAQDQPEDNGKGAQYGEPVVQRWKVGTVIQAEGGPVQGLFITIPVPTDWPEQRVRLVDEDFTRNVRSVRYRVLDEGVKQMVLSIPQIRAGEEARALLTFEIATCSVEEPADTSVLSIPRRVPRSIQRHLSTSPFINSRHSSIRRQGKELIEEVEGDWEKVRAIYDWVRENVEYQNTEMVGAVETLRNRAGSGEDLVSLFIALCRANRIPARTVWVQGHYYAEFYMEDDEGQGHWFPCQLAGNQDFGRMSDVRPILQKGDNINVPEQEERKRYVPELVKGKRSAGSPKVTFVRELLPDE